MRARCLPEKSSDTTLLHRCLDEQEGQLGWLRKQDEAKNLVLDLCDRRERCLRKEMHKAIDRGLLHENLLSLRLPIRSHKLVKTGLNKRRDSRGIGALGLAQL